jgi:hypothetical protein
MKSINSLFILILLLLSSQFESELFAQRKSRTPKDPVRSTPAENNQTIPKVRAPSRNPVHVKSEVKSTPFEQPIFNPSKPQKAHKIEYDSPKRDNINFEQPAMTCEGPLLELKTPNIQEHRYREGHVYIDQDHTCQYYPSKE